MQSPYSLFFTFGMFMCGLMIIVWLFRIKSKGASAYLMACAFATLGGLLYVVKNGLSESLQWSLCALLGLLLLGDAYARAVRNGEKIKR